MRYISSLFIIIISIWKNVSSLFVLSHGVSCSSAWRICTTWLKHYKAPISFGSLARAIDETKLWLSLSTKKRRNPCSGPHLCTRIWVRAMIGLLKVPLSICQSGWKETGNALLAKRLFRCGPRTRISALFRRHYLELPLKNMKKSNRQV